MIAEVVVVGWWWWSGGDGWEIGVAEKISRSPQSRNKMIALRSECLERDASSHQGGISIQGLPSGFALSNSAIHHTLEQNSSSIKAIHSFNLLPGEAGGMERQKTLVLLLFSAISLYLDKLDCSYIYWAR